MLFCVNLYDSLYVNQLCFAMQIFMIPCKSIIYFSFILWIFMLCCVNLYESFCEDLTCHLFEPWLLLVMGTTKDLSNVFLWIFIIHHVNIFMLHLCYAWLCKPSWFEMMWIMHGGLFGWEYLHGFKLLCLIMWAFAMDYVDTFESFLLDYVALYNWL